MLSSDPLALTAYAVMALAWTGAAALLIDGWRRDRAAAERAKVQRWRQVFDAFCEATSGPDSGQEAPGALVGDAAAPEAVSRTITEDAPMRRPGPVLPDAARDIARRKDRMEAQWQAAIRRRDDALRGLARHEAADWTGWRPSYDGEDVDPGEPWQPKQQGETE